MAAATTFFEESQKKTPQKLITYAEFEIGSSRVTINDFETKWSAITAAGYGAISIATVSNQKTSGNFSNQIQFNRARTLSAARRTVTALNLSSVDTLKFHIRSSATGFFIRLGLGAVSAGEFLPEVISIATVNQFLLRTIDIAPMTARSAITRLRLELAGVSGLSSATITLQIDNMYAVNRLKFANHQTQIQNNAVPPITIDSLSFSSLTGPWTFSSRIPNTGTVNIDTTIPGSGDSSTKVTFGRNHLMDNSILMDNSAPMINFVGAAIGKTVASPLDFRTQILLSYLARTDYAPATYFLEFGEATSSEQSQLITIATANIFIQKDTRLDGIPLASRDAMKFFRFRRESLPNSTIGATVSFWFDDLQAFPFLSQNPSRSYRVYQERLLMVSTIIHALMPVQARSQIANAKVGFANHDGYFYGIRDSNIVLARNIKLFTNFDGLPETQQQTLFDGTVTQEDISDEKYELAIEDSLSRFYRDIPITPIFKSITNLSVGNPYMDRADSGRVIPIGIGRISGGRALSLAIRTGGASYQFNDPAFGASKQVNAIFINDVLAATSKFTVSLISSKINFKASAAITAGQTVLVTFQGYKDDTDGQFTGTSEALIENPSDVYRFILLKVLGMTIDQVDSASLDTARTTWAGFRVANYLSSRRNSFQLLTSGPLRDGLSENIFSYFFQSNLSGKSKVITAEASSAATSGTYTTTGLHASILKNTFRKKAAPQNIVTQFDVGYNYNWVLGTPRDSLSARNTDSESQIVGYGKKEVVKLAGRWIPADATGLHVSYNGTGAACALTITGEGSDSTRTFKTSISAGHPKNLSFGLTAAAYNTLTELVNAINAVTAYSATLATGINGAMDSRGLRDTSSFSIKSIATGQAIKYSWAKLLALKNLALYKDNHDELAFKVPWIGLNQEIGSLINVRSLNESQMRRVRVYAVKREPLSGLVEFVTREE